MASTLAVRFRGPGSSMTASNTRVPLKFFKGGADAADSSEGEAVTQPGFVFARDTHVTHPAEIRRLAGQNLRILERLQQGLATNTELAALSKKYTGRISDLRAALRPLGLSPEVVERNTATGLTVYELVAWPR